MKRQEKKIEEVIQSCNYVPSATARNFAKQDSNMIGVIVPEAHNPYFAAALEGITKCWKKRNCY